MTDGLRAQARGPLKFLKKKLDSGAASWYSLNMENGSPITNQPATQKEQPMTDAKITLTQTEAAALLDLVTAAMTVKDTAADSDEWCRFCGEGHGFHEPNCPVANVDVCTATTRIATALDSARTSDETKARTAAATARILAHDAASRS